GQRAKEDETAARRGAGGTVGGNQAQVRPEPRPVVATRDRARVPGPARGRRIGVEIPFTAFTPWRLVRLDRKRYFAVGAQIRGDGGGHGKMMFTRAPAVKTRRPKCGRPNDVTVQPSGTASELRTIVRATAHHDGRSDHPIVASVACLP